MQYARAGLPATHTTGLEPVAPARVGRWRTSLQVAALCVVVLAALGLRLPRLGEPINSYDEGVYLEALLLMARGYDPFTEITVTQGPLHLHAQLPFFLTFGQTVAAGRAGAVVFSLVGLAGVWWLGQQLAGRWAGLAAAGLLFASPTYLRFSRQALADLPALAVVTLAVAAALAFRRTARLHWLVASALLLALGILMKPLVVPAGLAVAALVWQSGRRGWGNLALLTSLTTAMIVLILLALGPGPVLQQVLGFRDQARAAYGWSLSRNWDLLVDKLDQEQLGFYVLAATGAGVLLARAPRYSAGVVLWAVATLALLLAHSPLRYHHMVSLIPPLAVLGGAALPAVLVPLNRVCLKTGLLAVCVLVGLLSYASGVPELVRRDGLLLQNVDAAGAHSEETDDEVNAAERLMRLSKPDDFVVTDHPYLAFLAGRQVPPGLVDPSEARLLSGDLTEAEVVALAEAYNPEVVVLWSGRLSRLPSFMAWTTSRYEVVRRFGTVDDGQPRAVLRRSRSGNTS